MPFSEFHRDGISHGGGQKVLGISAEMGLQKILLCILLGLLMWTCNYRMVTGMEMEKQQWKRNLRLGPPGTLWVCENGGRSGPDAGTTSPHPARGTWLSLTGTATTSVTSYGLVRNQLVLGGKG